MMIRVRGRAGAMLRRKTMRGAMRKQIALAIVLALGAGTVALAATPEAEQACTNDAFQFCQNFIPDRNRVFSCLVENRRQISVACRTVAREDWFQHAWAGSGRGRNPQPRFAHPAGIG